MIDKEAVLEKFIQNAPFDGCSEKNFLHSVKQLGLKLDEHLLLFPRGYLDVIDFWLDMLDRKMIDLLVQKDTSEMKIRDRIAYALEVRFSLLQQQKQAFIHLFSFLALPLNKIKLIQSVFHTASEIWYWVGDESTDWNYYSKRLLLSYVYISSLLYWFQLDKDLELEKTKAFIKFYNERRIHGSLGYITPTKAEEKTKRGEKLKMEKISM